MKHLCVLSAVGVMCFSSCSSSPKKNDASQSSTLLDLLGPTTRTQTNHDVQPSLLNLFVGRLAPLNDIRIMQSGALDVVYTCFSFGIRNDRWPTNYAELSEFVDQSNGYLFLEKHDDTVLKSLANGALEIHYFGLQSTNEMKLSLGTWNKRD